MLFDLFPQAPRKARFTTKMTEKIWFEGTWFLHWRRDGGSTRSEADPCEWSKSKPQTFSGYSFSLHEICCVAAPATWRWLVNPTTLQKPKCSNMVGLCIPAQGLKRLWVRTDFGRFRKVPVGAKPQSLPSHCQQKAVVVKWRSWSWPNFRFRCVSQTLKV